ncbi:MAG: energy-coupling factor ABC transporter ATP-binding protein [Nitrososphaeria archaeon]|nr:energy-coupling factor ABC transporter ATP-binding protein [Nitrososphaeria archaeon]
MREPVIIFEHFTYSYPTKQNALIDVDLRIYSGETVGIIGPNGSGKSTLCKSLNGLVPHFYGGTVRGRVYVTGIDTLETTVDKLSMKVGLVFQEPETQLSGLAITVEDEVGFGLSMLGVDPKLIRERVKQALRIVGLEGFEKRSPLELSGGEQQRLAIATVLAMRPEIIVLDEPVALLDPIGKYQVLSTIKKLAEEEGLTIIIAEHEIEELAYIVDKIVVLYEGKIISVNDSRTVLSEVEKLKAIEIDPPSITELVFMLQKELGIKVQELPITIAEGLRIFREMIAK